MSNWHEAEIDGHRIRWKHDGEEHAHFSCGYTLERWDGVGFREVRSWSSRDWFVLGLLAAKTYERAVETERRDEG